MYCFRNFSSADVYLTSLIAFTAVIGDGLVSHLQLHLYKAIFDNVTHAIISGLSWFIVVLHFRSRYASQSVLEIFLSTVIASLIDLDHFVAAKSLHLKDAVNLHNRPVLHCSTVPLLLTVLLYALALVFEQTNIHRYALLVWLSFASHHTRDATRRGYWFYPLGSTAPIPYYMYIVLSCILPYVTIMIYKTTFPKFSRDIIVI